MTHFFAIRDLFWGKAQAIGDKVNWSVEKEGFTYLTAHLLRIQGPFRRPCYQINFGLKYGKLIFDQLRIHVARVMSLSNTKPNRDWLSMFFIATRRLGGLVSFISAIHHGHETIKYEEVHNAPFNLILHKYT